MSTITKACETPTAKQRRVWDKSAPSYDKQIAFFERVQFDGGREWLAAYDDVAPAARHLALHDGHMCGVNDRDRPFVTGELLAGAGLALDATAWREKLATAATAGATAIEKLLGLDLRAIALSYVLAVGVVVVNPDDVGRAALPAIIANHRARRIERSGQVVKRLDRVPM